MWMVCGDDVVGGGCERVAVAMAGASGYEGWIDPVMGSDFGLGWKCPPEKFSGDGGMVVAGIRWWPAVEVVAG
ncbi:hypothetical protein Tco_0632182 [Tanacetum coccineum]